VHLGRNLLSVIVVGLSLLIFPAPSLSSDTKLLPSLSDLEKLNFTAAKSDSLISPYDDVTVVRGLFLAYRAGSDAISKYHDPVPTRGTQGMTVFRTVSPAVVVVVVGRMKNQDFDPEGIGTGAIVDARGYVLTNWHVINGYRGALVFLKPSGNAELANAQAFGARVIYQDATVDLALLKLIDPPSNLPSLTVGDISQVQVAEDIHIVGHPHGNLWSYSTGVVSQIRDGYSWSYEDGSKHLAKVLQLQTAINPGNSGGPVVDDSGKILGLVAMSEGGQNLDYAIAADVIKRFLFTGMQMSTRGTDAATRSSVRPDQIFSATHSDRLSVLKAVYQDRVLYSINEVGGGTVGLIAKFSDGTIIEARDSRPDGSFQSWSETSSIGKKVVSINAGGTLVPASMR
jgi:S1-C subfamily serine protease